MEIQNDFFETMTGSNVITSAKEIRFYPAFVCLKIESPYATSYIIGSFVALNKGVHLFCAFVGGCCGQSTNLLSCSIFILLISLISNSSVLLVLLECSEDIPS